MAVTRPDARPVDTVPRTGVETWLIVIGLLAAFPSDASAYLDPASGSAMLQVLVGGLLAGVFVLKQYWRAFRARFTRKRSDERPTSRGPE
jgi:hypothetical protein